MCIVRSYVGKLLSYGVLLRHCEGAWDERKGREKIVMSSDWSRLGWVGVDR